MSYGMGAPKFTGDKIPSGYRAGQLQQYTPEQLDLFKQSFNHLGPDSMLSKLASGDQSQFAAMEAPALRQFNSLQGNIASRFSGQGMGGRQSSGFQNAQNAAATDFAQNLQSQRLGLQNQAIRDLMGMSHTLLSERPYERFLTEKQQDQGFNWGGLAGGLAGGVGGFFLGGPMGAMSGASLGYNAGSGLSGYGGGGGSNQWQSTPGWSPGWGGQSGQTSAANYDAEFRTNPAAMGY